VVPLTSHLVDAVQIHRAELVILIHRQVLWLAVYLAGTGEDDFDIRVVFPARFQNGELCSAVDLRVVVGVLHGVYMAGLSGQIN
jgi:hypothetical protein